MCAFVFYLICINNDVMAAISIEKSIELSRPQFSSDVLKFGVKITVEKIITTGSDVNLKTKWRFLLILIH